MPKATDFSNQEKLNFIVEYILNGGESTGGKSLQIQIAEAPESVLWKPLIDWGKYKTSVLQQLAYLAQDAYRTNAALAAQQSLLTQILTHLSNGVPVAIDYDRISADIKANMPEFVIPEFELIVKPKEGTQE